jgi:hypothetical protein
VEAAARAGVSHLGVVDRDGLYGVVRAHGAAKEHGLALRLGATVTIQGHPPISLLVRDREGWGQLCRLVTLARRRVEKGRAEATFDEVCAHSGGLVAALHHGWTPDRAGPLVDAFERRVAAILSRRLEPGDRVRVGAATRLSQALDVPLVASNLPLMHDAARHRVADVLTCIRRRTTLTNAGRALLPGPERRLLDEAAFLDRFRDHPGAVRAGVDLAESLTFSLDELAYQYPHEVVPEGWTAMSWLVHLTEEGLAGRYPSGAGRGGEPYFLTVHDVVTFARSRASSARAGAGPPTRRSATASASPRSTPPGGNCSSSGSSAASGASRRTSTSTSSTSAARRSSSTSTPSTAGPGRADRRGHQLPGALGRPRGRQGAGPVPGPGGPAGQAPGPLGRGRHPRRIREAGMDPDDPTLRRLLDPDRSGPGLPPPPLPACRRLRDHPVPALRARPRRERRDGGPHRHRVGQGRHRRRRHAQGRLPGPGHAHLHPQVLPPHHRLREAIYPDHAGVLKDPSKTRSSTTCSAGPTPSGSSRSRAGPR